MHGALCAKLQQQTNWQVGVGTEGSIRGIVGGKGGGDTVIGAGTAYGEDGPRVRYHIYQEVSSGIGTAEEKTDGRYITVDIYTICMYACFTAWRNYMGWGLVKK